MQLEKDDFIWGPYSYPRAFLEVKFEEFEEFFSSKFLRIPWNSSRKMRKKQQKIEFFEIFFSIFQKRPKLFLNFLNFSLKLLKFPHFSSDSSFFLDLKKKFLNSSRNVWKILDKSPGKFQKIKQKMQKTHSSFLKFLEIPQNSSSF